MGVSIESWSHGGSHCENDDRMARLTLLSLAVFAVIASLAMIAALRVG